MAEPQGDGDFDLNAPALEVGIDLNDPVDWEEVDEVLEVPGVDVYIPNPVDLEEVGEDVFDLNNPMFWESDEEDLHEEGDQDGAPEMVNLQHNGGANLEELPDLNQGLENDGIFEDVPPTSQGTNSSGVGRTRKQYSDDTKRAVYAMLLEGSIEGHLSDGLSLQVSLAMDVSQRCVQRIWNGQKGGGIHAVVNKRAKVCGRKRIDLEPEAITAIPFKDRTTLEDVARGLGMSKSTVVRRLKKGKIERHSNAIKPFLTDENKRSRVQFCLNSLESNTVPHQPVFKAMYNVVHVDEKWYYRTRTNQKFYCAPGEERPRRTCKSKNYIEKVMFLGGQARPRFNNQKVCTFDGKIGIYAFVFTEPAKRTSANRPRGTMITKPMTSVTRDVIRRYLIDKLLPDIKAKWPAEDRHNTIWIQQDNCRSHIPVDDSEFCVAAQADGWDIRLMCQPANSPDCNVLDLGFFAAIQALFYRSAMPNNIDEIVDKVVTAYQDFPAGRSNRVFLTLQGCLREILKEKGGQHYPVPHMKKAVLERLGVLPKVLPCDPAIVQEALEFLG